MDSTNGHSEKNPRKKENKSEAFEKFELEQTGEVRKIDINELPWDEQEKIRAFMEMTGDEEPPELFIADFNIKFHDTADIPMDLLADMFRDALMNDDFEKAEEYKKEVKKRGYSIEITDKLLTLKHKSLKEE